MNFVQHMFSSWLAEVDNLWTTISTKVGGLGVTKQGHEVVMAGGGGALWRGPGLYGFREETDSRHHFKTPTQVSKKQYYSSCCY